jgi:hypothetical protein
LLDRCRAPQDGWSPLHFAAERGHEAEVKQLLAAGADVFAAANDASTPRFIAQDARVRAILAAAEEEVPRLRSIAFAMGSQERLGAASVVRGLEDPELLRMVVEFVYPPSVENVPEAQGEINLDSDSE